MIIHVYFLKKRNWYDSYFELGETILYNTVFYFKSNLSLYSLQYAEACNEFAGPISASLRLGNTAPLEETLQRQRAVGNTVSDLTGPRFEPDLPLQRRTRYHSINRPSLIYVCNFDLQIKSFIIIVKLRRSV